MCGYVNSSTTINSSGNEVLLQLVTDISAAYTGFQVEIIFSYSESAGCGGQIDLNPTSSHTLKSPLIGNSFVYENYLDCTWNIKAPHDYVVNVEFISFHVSSCYNVNQTALGISTCNCDFVEFRDGINPNSIIIGTYCGHTLPPQIHSTYEYMSVRLATDGELASSESSRSYRGFEIEFITSGFCGRNYTDSQGRIKSRYPTPEDSTDCYTLITAPEHHTVALYFLFITPEYDNENVYLDIFDGNSTTSPLLVRFAKEAVRYSAVFSTGKSLLLHNHGGDNKRMLTFDSNYVATDKGRGCGGKLNNVVGRVMSPLYPEVYRQKSTCEWELETPHGTRVMVHFEVFDLGVVCDQNYLQLVNRDGNTISTFCSETPADYTSVDNYVKIIFTTTLNNGGTGWVADFVAIA
ncbi:Cubilin [Papilio machaon]|uniref:Cubilin n=1 Tax=Papilio machaon TaxID=76193 RepID=A0A194RDA9_PAPMA|nr:Cubilin [Papilio machaon]